GRELQLHPGELGRVGDGVKVVDDSLAGLELDEPEELAVAEGQHAGVPVDWLGDQGHATGGPIEAEGDAADDAVAMLRSPWRGAGTKVNLADGVGIEQLEKRVEVTAGTGGDEPLGDQMLVTG